MRYAFVSPGRINLIGEHTDYNRGYVLPAAIDRYTYLEFEESELFEVCSERFGGWCTFELNSLKEEKGWLNYVKGTFLYFKNFVKKDLHPWKVKIGGDLPAGSGLSSSASLIVGIIYALSELEEIHLSRREVAKLAHKVETEFVGVNCGIMDQFAIAMGRENSFMLIDAMKESVRYIYVEGFPAVTVIDSGIRHKLTDGGYNIRQQECKEAERIVGVPFREMNMKMVEKKRDFLSDKLYKRALHVINENERVLKAVEAIGNSDWRKLGNLLYESHQSLRDLFEVSVREIDFIVESLSEVDSVYGARIMGGGFGGSVLVISSGNIDDELKGLRYSYMKKFGVELKDYSVNISSGVRELKRGGEFG